MAGADYESVLCVKPQVHVFRIPPRPSNRGYRASDWKLDQPDWSGRLRVVSKGSNLFIKLEDKTSGELFAKCPVESYPGIAVESVTDSSRYFVLRIMDDNGRSAFIGVGFEDRGDSFDLNVALQDHFKHVKQEKDAEKTEKELQNAPKLDLGFKEGQTIRINIATNKNKENGSSTTKSRPRGTGGGGGVGFLPPPPGGAGTAGGIKLPPPGGAGISNLNTQNTFQSQQTNMSSTNPSVSSTGSAGNDLDQLLNFDSPSLSSNPVPVHPVQPVQPLIPSQNKSHNLLDGFDSDFDMLRDVSKSGSAEPLAGSSDPWGEFTGASSSSMASASNNTDDNWVQF